MTGVNALNELFFSPMHYVDLKSREECSLVFLFALLTGLSSALCRPDFNQVMTYGFGSQQFNGIPLTETVNMPSRFFISNRFLVGDCLAFIALNPRSQTADEIGMTEILLNKLFMKGEMLLLVNL